MRARRTDFDNFSTTAPADRRTSATLVGSPNQCRLSSMFLLRACGIEFECPSLAGYDAHAAGCLTYNWELQDEQKRPFAPRHSDIDNTHD